MAIMYDPEGPMGSRISTLASSGVHRCALGVMAPADFATVLKSLELGLQPAGFRRPDKFVLYHLNEDTVWCLQACSAH